MKPEITVTENQSIVTFNNVPACYEASFVLDALEHAANVGVNIDMIAQSPATSDKISFGFTFADEDMPKLLAIINSLDRGDTPPPLVNCGDIKITVKTEEMVGNSGFAAKVFRVMKETECLPLLVTTGLDEISLLVRQSDFADLEKELKKAFGVGV
jgi:aspartokinase